MLHVIPDELDLDRFEQVVALHGLDFVSARVHDYAFHPYWGLIADQLRLQ